MIEEIITYLQDHSTAIITPFNVLTALIGFVVAWIYGIKATRTKGDIRLLASGIAFTALGIAIQKSYWVFIRLFCKYDLDKSIEILFQDWAWLTSIPLVFIIIGYSKHLQLIIAEAFGNYSFLKWFSFLVLSYFGLFALIHST